MPAQLIFASAPAGRTPGRSGYCTVARDRELPERLVAELERLSAHEPGGGAAYVFRTLRAGGATVAVITRYADAGADYTGRASTLAHHLVFTAAETETLPPPADIARRFRGWVDRWEGPPAWLEPPTGIGAGEPVALPARRWKALTGDAGNAAAMVDDAGNARTAAVPASVAETALELLAEAALLTRDRGWSAPFSTRRAPLDPDAVWRAGAALPSGSAPAGRRATLARSGVMPGVRPTVARAPASVLTNEPAPPPSARRIPYAYIAAALLCAGIPAVLVFMRREPPPPAPVAEPPPVPALAPSPALSRAVALADAADWPAFHAALAALTPAERRLSAIGDRIGVMRRRLHTDMLAPVVTALDTATAPADTAALARFRERLTALSTLAAESGATPTEADRATLAHIDNTLTLMEAVNALPKSAFWMRPSWSVLEETPLAVTRTHTGDASPALLDFLKNAKAPVRATCATYAGPANTSGAPAPVELAADELDFLPGKILALSHREWGRILELRLTAEDRLTLTWRAPASADARLTRTDAPTRVRLSAGERTLDIILNPPASADTLSASAGLLRASADGVSAPAWLMRARVFDGGTLVLLPGGLDTAGAAVPRPPTPVSVVVQALHTRLARTGDTQERARLQQQLAEASAQPVRAGAPWTLALIPAGAGAPTPLIRFIP